MGASHSNEKEPVQVGFLLVFSFETGSLWPGIDYADLPSSARDPSVPASFALQPQTTLPYRGGFVCLFGGFWAYFVFNFVCFGAFWWTLGLELRNSQGQGRCFTLFKLRCALMPWQAYENQV